MDWRFSCGADGIRYFRVAARPIEANDSRSHFAAQRLSSTVASSEQEAAPTLALIPEPDSRSLLSLMQAFAGKRMLATLARLRYAIPMKARFTYWQERDGRFLGYLNDYPDHWTQGEDLADLKAHLRDLFQTFTTDQIPGIKKVEELEIA